MGCIRVKFYAAVAAMAALMAFAKWSYSTVDAAGYNRAVSEYESSLRKDLNIKINQITVLQSKNDKLVTDALEREPEIRTVYKTIKEKVKVYVKDNRNCNLSIGAAIMRNNAADPSTEQMPGSGDTAISESDAKKPSKITQRMGEEQVYKWAEIYNKLSGRYKLLYGYAEVCEKQQ